MDHAASWLVARFAIVAKKIYVYIISYNIMNIWYVWKFHCCSKNSWQTIFCQKTCPFPFTAWKDNPCCIACSALRAIWIKLIKGYKNLSLVIRQKLKKHVCVKKKRNMFFWKNIVCLPFPKESDRLLYKPLLKNSFSTNFQGTGLWEGNLVGLFPGFAIAANFSRAPGAKRRKEGLFQKQLPSSKSKPFPKESDRLLNPL